MFSQLKVNPFYLRRRRSGMDTVLQTMEGKERIQPYQTRASVSPSHYRLHSGKKMVDNFGLSPAPRLLPIISAFLEKPSLHLRAKRSAFLGLALDFIRGKSWTGWKTEKQIMHCSKDVS